MNKKDVIYKLKLSKPIRLLFFPSQYIKRNKQYKEFTKSIYPQRIKKLKSTHIGEKCVIVGNGPSLKIEDLNRIMELGLYSFATNSIYKFFDKTSWRPSMYISIDRDVINNSKNFLTNNDIDNIWLDYPVYDEVKDYTNDKINFLYSKSRYTLNKYTTDIIEFNDNADKYFGFGYSVTFTVLQMAVYMGFSEIYLIGMDHTVSHVVDSNGRMKVNGTIKNHFDNEKFFLYQAQFKDGLEYGYKLARNYAEKHGVSINNATRGGKLEIFNRVDIDKILY